ncbi:MAG: CDP-archaeol synthase [Gammaproteobacteria bacterium]|nr:CDP-archaeol synthase [Gammaproteobacteria bacterium]
MVELLLLLLLLTANGSPIIAREILGDRLDFPLDHATMLADGHRLLGASKTYRGLVAALLSTSLLATIFGLHWSVGAIIAAVAMLGDALSSFIKRRLGLPVGAMALGLDHVPESLLPLLACKPLFDLSWIQLALLTLAFMLLHRVLSHLLYRLGVRKRPY